MLTRALQNVASRFHPRRSPRALIWAVQIAIFALSGVFAFLLRFEFELKPPFLAQMALAIPVWVVVKTIVFRLLKLDRGWWRYVSMPDLVRVVFGNFAGAVFSALILLATAPKGFPRSIYILDFILCANATVAIRVVARIVRDYAVRSKDETLGKRIVIYGAGQAGDMLLREIRTNPRLAYDVRGFIDDNPQKAGMRVQLVTVLGTGPHLTALAARHSIDEVLIAIPSATGLQMTGILQCCHQAGLRCKTIPSLGELIEEKHLSTQIRDVAVEDLLGRTPISLDESAIRARLEGVVVAVTGAAGSIGAEICRQIARFHPLAIVALDAAETPLFHIEQEMRAAFPGLAFHPEIGSVQNYGRLAEIFDFYGPSIVYHAAAYKHVPMMEANLFEAVENNILGTANVAAAAAAYGIDDFVMISSDKAVHPTSIMGLSKRVAELLARSLQDGSTRFVSVRFGNVLGSNGSVIPIFKRQIAAGGPVTVTHPEMRRYFMTIPEAVQLVLQASTMGKGGEIFVLDMGQPVKIVDLARNLILLSGLRPDQDVRIEFTGVRPGEKLYEELTSYEENTAPTFHEKIKIFTGAVVSFEEMQSRLAVIRRLCAARDGRGLLLELKDLVPDYNPSKQVLRKLLAEPHTPQDLPASSRYDRNDRVAATGVPNLDAGTLACENEKSA
jgi:FlaA1/EpsC-like NDP-sugar epimerase